MRLGIRVQILLLLGVLLAVAFVPLYFAVARLTSASLIATRREAARDLGRAVASHVLTTMRDHPSDPIDGFLESQLSEGGITSIAVYDGGGRVSASAGDRSLLPAEAREPHESANSFETGGGGSVVVVVVPTAQNDGAVGLAIVLPPEAVEGRSLVRLVALYTGIMALALLVFAYFAMTRLVVRPVENVSRAAGRVAGGARTLELEASSARELAELGDSLREMTDRLIAEEQALRAKVDELEAAKRELESAQQSIVRSERLASVGRLAAGVAHEIGNPIAAILGFEELLLGDDLPADERRDFLVRMKSETERVHRVLRDLLDFARPGGSTPQADADATSDVHEAVQLVTALLKPQKKLSRLGVEISIASSTPLVCMSSERLQQILLNLLLNAADAARSRIKVETRSSDDGVEILVADDGDGVAAEVRDRLFEPFVTTKEVGRGTGLGLAVCRGLVEAAGGTIVLGETELGGACFVLRLRRAP